jgi:hypothetical protein
LPTSPSQYAGIDSIYFNPHRKLLVAAANELLERGLIFLDTIDDLERIDDGHVFADIFGRPSVIL